MAGTAADARPRRRAKRSATPSRPAIPRSERLDAWRRGKCVQAYSQLGGAYFKNMDLVGGLEP